VCYTSRHPTAINRSPPSYSSHSDRFKHIFSSSCTRPGIIRLSLGSSASVRTSHRSFGQKISQSLNETLRGSSRTFLGDLLTRVPPHQDGLSRREPSRSLCAGLLDSNFRSERPSLGLPPFSGGQKTTSIGVLSCRVSKRTACFRTSESRIHSLVFVLCTLSPFRPLCKTLVSRTHTPRC